MLTAADLMTGVRRDLEPLSARIRSHPYVSAVVEGRLPRASLRLFAGEQYHIIKNDVRSFATLLSRQDDAEVRRFLAGSVDFECGAFDAIFPFAAAVGMDEAELEAYEPLPGAHAYTAFLALTAVHGNAADMAGAFIVDLEGWGANCGAISRALRERYAFAAAEVAFFDHFAAADPTFEARSLAVMDRVLAAGADAAAAARSVHRTARLMMSYELMYWDTLLEASLP
jgi:pyrroloquinoline quinone (PQQ) biosynthesis protein C